MDPAEPAAGTRGRSPWPRRLLIVAFVLIVVSEIALQVIHRFEDHSKLPPELFASFVETAHYSIASDSSSVAAVQSWGAFAERCHAHLESSFAPLSVRDFDVAVCTSDTNYDVLAVTLGQNHTAGVCFDGVDFAMANVSSPVRGPRVLEHELTHVFVKKLMPRAPTWLNEGLAVELAHDVEVYQGGPELDASIAKMRAANAKLAAAGAKAKTEIVRKKFESIVARLEATTDWVAWSCPEHDPPAWRGVPGRCSVRGALRLSPTERADLLAALPAFDRSRPDVRKLYQLAGAVVRWGIETRHPKSAVELESLTIDAAAFGAWLDSLRAGAPAGFHASFGPLLSEEPW